MPACIMCHSLYVKANGELPCWDDVGEDFVLRTLDAGKLQEGLERNIFHSPELLHIREAFLGGEYPHPGLCERCAVRHHGGAHLGLRPNALQVLHLEASYLCHLSCPLCIPAAARHSLKAPPYHMSIAMLDGLLRQLRKDGVDSIRVVHFEGRGDPLMNPHLGELVRVTKAAYPDAFTMVTTHGSYPYKSWIVDSGLDQLRVSVDGAFPSSYEKYRVGGNLATVLEFFRQIRDAKHKFRKTLHVEWKYILFEWNDTDEEIRHAAQLATELDVQLRFTLTHSPGKSKRFVDPRSLVMALPQLAPRAEVDTTFDLREEDETADVGSVIANSAATLLSGAVDAIRRTDEASAIIRIERALKYDPGISTARNAADSRDLVEQCFSQVLSQAKFPSTLGEFAAVCRVLGFRRKSRQLLYRYLEIAPNAPNRELVLRDLGKPHLQQIIDAMNSIVLWLRRRVRLRTRLRHLAYLLVASRRESSP